MIKMSLKEFLKFIDKDFIVELYNDDFCLLYLGKILDLKYYIFENGNPIENSKINFVVPSFNKGEKYLYVFILKN